MIEGGATVVSSPARLSYLDRHQIVAIYSWLSLTKEADLILFVRFHSSTRPFGPKKTERNLTECEIHQRNTPLSEQRRILSSHKPSLRDNVTFLIQIGAAGIMFLTQALLIFFSPFFSFLVFGDDSPFVAYLQPIYKFRRSSYFNDFVKCSKAGSNPTHLCFYAENRIDLRFLY
jgi:hypothetical protein